MEQLCVLSPKSKKQTVFYENLTAMQKLDVFNYVAANTPGRDIADLLWLESDV
jgi:hypothetical protein